MTCNVVPLIVAIPLGGAFLIPLIARRVKVLADVIGNLATGSLIVIAILLFRTRCMYSIGRWNPPIGINWVLDGFSNDLLH